MIESNYVYSYFKTYFPAWWSSTSRDPGPGCGDACEPLGATARGENAFLHDNLGMNDTEYLECLNKATNGGVVKAALWN